MKKSSFVAMVLGTVSVVLFALGMCMATIPEWNAFRPGIIFSCVGLVLGLINGDLLELYNQGLLFHLV